MKIYHTLMTSGERTALQALRKLALAIVLALVLSGLSTAQVPVMARQVLASAGLPGNTTPAGLSVSWTAGQGIAGMLDLAAGSQLLLNQGFQQPSCILSGAISVVTSGLPDSLRITCAQDTVMLRGITDIPDAILSWRGPGNYSSPDSNAMAVVPGTYFLRASTGICSREITVEVVQDTLAPDIVIANDQDTLTCTVTEILLEAETMIPNPSLTWNTGASGRMISALSSGTYIVTVTDPSNGCASIAERQIGMDTLSPLLDPLPEFILDCSPDTQFLMATSPDPSVNFAWYDPSGNLLPGPAPAILTEGVFRLVVTAANGCTREVPAIVQASADLPRFISVTTGTLTCRDTTAVIQIETDPPTGLAFTWQRDGMNLPENTNSIVVDRSGPYFIEIFNPANQCRNSRSISVPLDTMPPMLTSGPEPYLLTCDEPVAALSVSVNGDVSFIWRGPNGPVPASGNTLEADAPGVWTVEAVRADNGCSASRQFQVQTDITEPKITFPAATEWPCNQRPVTLVASVSGTSAPLSQLDLLWKKDDQTLDSQALSIAIWDSGLYRLEVTDVNGCTGAETVSVSLPSDTLITYLSPNGDGINDRLELYLCSLPREAVYKVSVFNRWGDLIFHSDHYAHDWQGGKNGVPVPDGTYYYVVEVAGKIFKSVLTLRR